MADWTHYSSVRYNAPGTVSVTQLITYNMSATPAQPFWMWEINEISQMYMRYRAGESPTNDSGYFFLEVDATGETQKDSGHIIVVESGLAGQFSGTPAINCYGSSGTFPAYMIVPQPNTLDILPDLDLTAQDTIRPYPGLCSPFLKDNGDHADDIEIYAYFNGGILTGLCSIKYYCPWAWHDTNMYKVLSTIIYDFITAEDDSTEDFDYPEGDDSAIFNKTEFANCDEADWYPAGSSEYFVVRKEGETLLELMKRVVRHFPYFWLSFDMQGKLSLTSTIDPAYFTTVTTLHGIIGDIVYSYDPAFHCNIGLIRYHQNVIVRGGSTSRLNNPTTTAWKHQTQWEEFPSGGHQGVYEVECVGSAPLDASRYHPEQYVWIKGKRVDLTTQFREQRSDNPEQEYLLGGEVQVLHLPFVRDGATRAIFAIKREMETYNQIDPRIRMKITQDLQGLDYDVGHRVTLSYMKGDGEASVTTFCMSKKIDFNNLTVESELLEVPAAPSPT